MNNDDCVTVEIEVDGCKIYIGIDKESTLAQLRAHVETNYGALNVWSNSYSHMVDYTETMQEIRANAELAHDEDDGPYTGIVHFTAWYEAVIAGTEQANIDVNDVEVLALDDYIDIMHDTPALTPHRHLRIVIENFTGYGDKFCAQSVDTGVSISYFYALFPPNFPVQFHRRGRPLVAGPLKHRIDLDDLQTVVVQATGKVLGGMPKRDAAAAELEPVLNRRRAACSGGLGGGAWAEYILQILVYAYFYSMVPLSPETESLDAAVLAAIMDPAAAPVPTRRAPPAGRRAWADSIFFYCLACCLAHCLAYCLAHCLAYCLAYCDAYCFSMVAMANADVDSGVPADSVNAEPESGSGVVLSRRRAACRGGLGGGGVCLGRLHNTATIIYLWPWGARVRFGFQLVPSIAFLGPKRVAIFCYPFWVDCCRHFPISPLGFQLDLGA